MLPLYNNTIVWYCCGGILFFGGIIMKWVYRLERRLGRNFGIPNLMIYITSTMLAVYILGYFFMPSIIGFLSLSWRAVLQGQIWRLITFLVLPPTWGNVLLLFIALYATYHIGNTLEMEWGTTLFTIYFLLGAVGAILAAILTGYGTNYYLYLSLFLAYAYLYPNATFMLFFLIPIKAKWLAAFNWALYFLAFAFGSMTDRAAIVFSLLNFFSFFGPDVFRTIKQNYQAYKRRREFRRNWKNNPW